MRKKPKITRRNFLKKTGGLAAGALVFPYIVPAKVIRAQGQALPSNRITLGFIGTGDHGVQVNLRSFLPQGDAQVTAFCDVDEERLQDARNEVKKQYGEDYKDYFTTGDWREIVDRKDIDAVVISTPDHWHVLPAIAAAKAGKDVFCEKPLTLTVHEGRVLSDTIKRYGRVFQTASENRSKWNFLKACELVRNGRIGRLHTIRTHLPHGKTCQVQPVKPAPKGLDWDMWQGQTPWRDYCDFGAKKCHYEWRWILDYSGGQLTDWGAHINDLAQWANDTEYTGPVSVDGKGAFPEEGLWNTAVEWEIMYQYANGVRLICKNSPPKVNFANIKFEGSEGWIFCMWNTIEASSAKILNSVIGPGEIHLRTCKEREHRDFLDGVKTRRQPYYPVEVGHRTVSISHIGNICLILGHKLEWDPDKEQFINDPQANRMLSRAMRSPWRL